MALALVLPLCLAPADAIAQRITPWTPPSSDSLARWASEARVLFRANKGDSVSGENYQAYEMSGMIARRLLRSLGRANLRQAQAIKPVLDSLGLETDVAIDGVLPDFALVMVRNPFNYKAPAVGYLYWYKERDLRMQGVQFDGGMSPQMRVWWTGRREAPYSWAVVDRIRGDRPEIRVTLLRLNSTGTGWSFGRSATNAPPLKGVGSVAWADFNGDLVPEMTAWIHGEDDSLVTLCQGCTGTITELTYVERPEGLALHDSRVLPTPYTTLAVFLRLLIEGNRTGAERLLKTPARYQQAVTEGWATRRAHGTWMVEATEADSPWPQWLIVRFKGPNGDRRYKMNFELDRGRWVIRDWEARTIAPGP